MSPPPCHACGYDRTGIPPDAPCPECGSLVLDHTSTVPLSHGASRAVVSLGLGTLAWLGLIGFGFVAVILGIGAVGVGVSALQTLKREDNPRPGPTATAISGLLLGLTAVIAGLCVSWLILSSL